MEIINTELTTGEIANRLRAKREKAWTYTSTHGKTCEKCAECVRDAESFATVRGSVSSTYSLTDLDGTHSGTATRVR
jgi:7-cyano-7-deazaguanine synthase in queuosine biosynthesis